MKILTMSLLLLNTSGFCSSELTDGGRSLMEVREFPVGSFTRVEAHSDRGNVDVHGISDPVAKVSWSKRTSDTGCSVGAIIEDGVLKLINKKSVSGEGCTVDWNVKVPKDVPLNLKLGMSETRLSGLTGDVSLDVGMGKLTSDSRLSKLVVNAGQLDGDVSNVFGSSSFDLGSGNIRMSWMEIPPLLSSITFNFGNGNAVVSVPDGSTVNLDNLDTTPGMFGFGGFRKTSEVPSSSTPNFHISGGGGTGSVEVKKNSGFK